MIDKGMFMKIKVIITSIALVLCAFLNGEEINLIPNPALQSKNGFLPDQWGLG